MRKQIALLRGINVSGHKLIKMLDLKAHLEDAGLDSVVTYIQSGNIVFESEIDDAKELESIIHTKIKKEYGFDVPILVKSHEELKYALNNNPFLTKDNRPTKKCYFTFLSDLPSNENIDNLAEATLRYPEEHYILDEKYIFLYSEISSAKAKISNNFFENKLRVSATTRNWNTVNKLVEMSSSELE